jgi:hypothetical protein
MPHARARRRQKRAAIVAAAALALAARSTAAAAPAAVPLPRPWREGETNIPPGMARAACYPRSRCGTCTPSLRAREPAVCAETGSARRVACKAAGAASASSSSPPAPLDLVVPEAALMAPRKGGKGSSSQQHGVAMWMPCTRGPEEEEEQERPQDDEEEEEEVEVEEEEEGEVEGEEDDDNGESSDKSVLAFELGVAACLGAAWPVMAWRKRRMRQGYLPL